MKKGFTLIELLIVVAIIAILAAIAVPNFLEAQTRSKISRVKNDLRTVAMSLECYRTDNNAYPIPFVPSTGLDKMFELTTPIAYLTSLPKDPYNKGKGWGLGTANSWATALVDNYKYANYKDINVQTQYGASASWLHQAGHTAYPQDCFLVFSYGPDEYQNLLEGYVSLAWDNSATPYDAIYDPTNGTVSLGDIGRVGGSPKSKVGRILVSGK